MSRAFWSRAERLLTEAALYINAITNPVAIRAFTPVTAMPRYRPPMTFSDRNLCCLPGTAVSQCFFVCLVDITRETGIRSGGKYKSELEGKVFHREHTTALATEYFSPVPVGDRTDEASIQR
jgi:hypothetical protein